MGGFDRKPGGTSLVQETFASRSTEGTPGKRTLTEQLGGQRTRLPDGTARAESAAHGVGTQRHEAPFEAKIRSLLEANVTSGDIAGSASRKRGLTAAFEALSPAQRAELLPRLASPQRGDHLAELFKLRLATATRNALLAILRDRPDAKEAGATSSTSAGPRSAAQSAEPRNSGKADTWNSVLGEASTTVGKLGRVEAPRGLRLYASPAKGATLAILPFDTLLHVERKTAHGWYYVVSLGGAREGGSVTGQGCVEGQFVELDPPETTAHLHYVQPGEMLKDIAAKHYKPKQGFEWGADARLYVEAIWEANKNTGKLLRSGGELSWSEKAPRSEQQEKTQQIWRSVQPKKNHAIWIPSQAFVTRLEKDGAITGGSISHAAWQSAKEVGEELLEFAKYAGGFVVGVLEGAYEAARDLVMGVAELLGMLYDLVKSLISEGLVGTAQAIGKKLVALFKHAPALLQQAGSWFAGKWNQPGDFDRGQFHGEVIGYVLMQALIAFLTMGGSAALQASGKFATLIKVVRGLDAAGDILSYVRGAAKAVKLPASALAKLGKRGSRAADAIEHAADAAGDASRKAHAAEHAGDAAHGAAERGSKAAAGNAAKLPPRLARAADELSGLLARDPDAFIAHYRKLADSLKPDELAALKDTLRTRGRVTPASSAGLKPKQLIELHRKRVIALREIGELEQMSFHGTGASMMEGLEKTHGEILPAAELDRRGLKPSTGEGDKYTPTAGLKEFVSVGDGESGFGTAMAYADAARGLPNYNPGLHSDAELTSSIERLESIVSHFDSVQNELRGPLAQLGAREKKHFVSELDKLKAEAVRREDLPANSPVRRGGHASADNHPMLFEFDLRTSNLKREPRTDVKRGGALGGESSVHGAIDLKQTIRRVYVPAEHVREAEQKLAKIFGHRNFEVIAMEAVDGLPQPGVLGSSRVATYKAMGEMEKQSAAAERAYAAAIREGRPLDVELLLREMTR